MMRNEVHYFHAVWFIVVFRMLCLGTILVSCASELVSNKTMVNDNKCIETERRALLDIKLGLVDIHGDLSSWGSSKQEENCCQWSSVECDLHTGHVTHLHLSYLNDEDDESYTGLTSNISSSLLHLRNLKYLDLSHNVFVGVIPDELGNLSKLSYLDLSETGLDLKDDSIDWLFHLSSLTYLDLSSTYFGDVTFNDWRDLIYKLPSLSILRLSGCSLDCFGAPSSSFTNSSAPISVLHLGGNFLDLSIFDWISNFSASLVDLDLSNNELEGIVPTDSIFHIVTLKLHKNNFTSAIFDWVSNMSTTLINLDLSDNLLQGQIPNSFGVMSGIAHLDLSFNQLEGIVPTDSIFHIVTLKLYENKFTSAIFDWVSNMSTTLVNLDLSGNLLQGQIPNSFGVMSGIAHLDLSFNQLEGIVPTDSIFHIVTLKLHKNNFTSAIFDWVSNMSTTLINLDLSENLLQGQIPNSFGVMSGIAHLNLSFNQLEGMIPNSFHNLSSLQTVDFTSNNLTGNLQDLLYLLPEATLQTLSISENQLTGSLPDITAFSFLEELNVDSNQLNGYLPKKFEHKSVLRTLSLSNNYLKGSLPNFTGFSFLQNLYLNDNKFSGSLPDFTGCSALKVLQFGGNQLTDWETQSIGQLTNLYQLDLSRNYINSSINELHLSKLYNLSLMNASFNSLTFNMSSEWLPPFNLVNISLASCRLGPKFPIWIRNQTQIRNLDFSNTQISDTFPMWFWQILDSTDMMSRNKFGFHSPMTKIDLSSNKIRGNLSSIKLYYGEINLSYNELEGPLPFISPTCFEVNLSHNKFRGKLSSTSEYMSLRFLDLSHNSLSGEVPDSWKYFEDLMFLNLGNNNFSGRVPMSIGDLTYLNNLILRNNKLSGELPESLRNCANLGFVDFGLNGLSGTVPEWIGQDLPQLYALVLKSNKFYGSLPYDLCHLSHLQFLDLSINRLSGNVPQCFSNLTAMIFNGTRMTYSYFMPRLPRNGNGNPYYDYRGGLLAFSYLDDALAGWKGKEREYKGNFAYLKMIDLSSNKFTGEIPTGITRLLDLKGLNLSRNKFYGKVPVQIGRLSQLEVLDLSSNKFSGEIPRSMHALTFLAYLDLSSNNFSGRIPLGSQFQTFNSSMYEGNPGLCGLPLTKRCPGDEIKPSSNGNEVDEDEIVYKRWLYVSAALGFSTAFWGICATLILNKRWRDAYFLFLMNLKDQLYVFMVVHIARLKVRLQG